MKIKNIVLFVIVIVMLMLNVDFESDFEKYKKLKINNVPSIKREDLPLEFSKKAFEIVDEFIKKTADCNKEILIYFDYGTGDVIDCVIGDFDNVASDIDINLMAGKNIASIHNHSKDVFSPPSGKNFGILMRNFEDYELIASVDALWVLKAKGVNEKLNIDLKIASNMLFNASFEYCRMNYDEINEINDRCDELYGNQLLKYINNKNINDIQLSRKEYSTMTTLSKSNQAEYNCRKRITDPMELKKIDDRINNPYILTGKDRAYAFYQLMGVDVEYDEIFEKD